MNTISINYTLVWRFKAYPHLQVTKCRKVCNVKTGRQLKITTNGGSIGIWVAPKVFIVKAKINDHLELIPKKEQIPF